MPELPEVETIRRGIEPHVVGRTIRRVIVRDRRLRWPIPRDFASRLQGRTITRVDRRGKYLLLELGGSVPHGRVILHMGMTGNIALVGPERPVKRHDHLDLELSDGVIVRFNDSRRFGAALWWPSTQATHSLLRHMGPEPFGEEFSAAYLFRLSRGRTAAIKSFLMDGRVVVGVGNIYAVEALFRARIRPMRAARRVTRAEYRALVSAVRTVLTAAIEAGGTTFRDFRGTDGEPGYFAQKLFVYDRAGAKCRRCPTPVRRVVIGQRSTYYCPKCQK